MRRPLRLEICPGSSFPSHRKHLNLCYKEKSSLIVCHQLQMGGCFLMQNFRTFCLTWMFRPVFERKHHPLSLFWGTWIRSSRSVGTILRLCSDLRHVIPSVYVPLVPHAPHLMPSNLVTFGEEYQSWSFGAWDFLHSPDISSLLRAHIFISTMCCDAVSLFLSCYERPSFTPLQNCSKNYNFLNFKPYFVVR